mmetsp:Transcript_78103/g.121826  ORF Transcript_78103/g.121826 Transcript_78103/m.121826 type:complete len:262 (-) Transcript_78103:1037-1822(-)
MMPHSTGSAHPGAAYSSSIVEKRRINPATDSNAAVASPNTSIAPKASRLQPDSRASSVRRSRRSTSVWHSLLKESKLTRYFLPGGAYWCSSKHLERRRSSTSQLAKHSFMLEAACCCICTSIPRVGVGRDSLAKCALRGRNLCSEFPPSASLRGATRSATFSGGQLTFRGVTKSLVSSSSLCVGSGPTCDILLSNLFILAMLSCFSTKFTLGGFNLSDLTSRLRNCDSSSGCNSVCESKGSEISWMLETSLALSITSSSTC